MTHCPSCGRYVGPHEGCPYCGARLTGRMPIRVLKTVAILLTMVGLPVLWFAATRAEVPTVAIGQTSAMMNLAYIRIEGRCSRPPSYDPETEHLSFWVADDTVEIHVVSYGAETRTLISEGNVPAFGDRISVTGTLRIRDDFHSLTVDAPDQLAITRDVPLERAIGSIKPDDEYRRVLVRGEVRDVVEPYPGLTLITLRDRTGAIDVAVSDQLVALSGLAPSIEVSQPVEVTAAVSLYGKTPQLVPASVADIVPLDEDVPIANQRFIVELSDEDVGCWLGVRGTVAQAHPFSSGVKLAVDDGSGVITVLLWQDVYDGLRQGLKLAPGAEIAVEGELAEYGGKLEVVPGLAADVQILAPAAGVTEGARTPESAPLPGPTQTQVPREVMQSGDISTSAPKPTRTLTPPPAATPAVDLTAISAIAIDSVGEIVTVDATVVDAASFSEGFKFTLEDGTGQLVLLMWHEVYDDCWDAAQINLGATVRVTGEVSQYEGQLQLEPRFGRDVKVTGPGDAHAPRREIVSISAADEGQWVMVEGEVVRIEGFSSGVQVFLRGDGSAPQAEIPVFIWRNVLDRIADNTGLGALGSRVRVVGRVQVYDGIVEIAPALPNDVMVLASP